MATHLRCPLCSAPLQVIACTTLREFHPGYLKRGEPLPEFEVPTTVVACSGCEFVVDLEYGDRSLRPAESLEVEMAVLMRQAQGVQS